MNDSASKSARRNALFKLALVLLLGVGAGVGLFIMTLRSGSPAAVHAAMTAADLQGLIDQDAQPFKPEQLQGRYTVVYFGFTMCPDACPTALYNLTLVLQQLDAEAKHIQPVFVSVDPARDTPQQINQYLAHYSDQWLGLTGDAEVMRDVEQRFGVIALEHRDESLPGGYTMDHSNEFLLLTPAGKLLTRLPADESVETLLEQLRALTKAESV